MKVRNTVLGKKLLRFRNSLILEISISSDGSHWDPCDHPRYSKHSRCPYKLQCPYEAKIGNGSVTWPSTSWKFPATYRRQLWSEKGLSVPGNNMFIFVFFVCATFFFNPFTVFLNAMLALDILFSNAPLWSRSNQAFRLTSIEIRFWSLAVKLEFEPTTKLLGLLWKWLSSNVPLRNLEE